jgi:tetratricopeptide (TPR) repeat protein
VYLQALNRLTQTRSKLGTFVMTALAVTLLGAMLGGCRRTPEAEKYLSRGKQLVEKKEYTRALLEFMNASRAQPKNAEPYYQSGLAYLAMGDYRTAYGNLLRATELDPNHKGAQIKLAEVIGSSAPASRDPKNLEEAEKRVRTILAIVPDSPDAMSALGITEYLLGKPVDGIKHLQMALEKFPQHLQSAKALADIKLSQKDFKGAEQILKRVADESPNSVEAQLALARFYVLTGRAGDAEATYRRALSIDPKYGPALLDLVRVQLGTGQKAGAEKTLITLSSLPDKQYRPLYALFLFDQGRREEALKMFEQQAKDDPKDRDAFLRLSSAYFFAKRFPDVERVINEALKRNPKDVSALLERAKLYLVTAKVTEAETDLNQVLKLEPYSAMAYYLLSKVSVGRGQQQVGRQHLSRALDFKPDLLAARIELAQSLTAARDGKSALILLNATPESQKKLLPVIVAVNWALFYSGDHAEMRKRVAAALAVYPGAPDLLLQDGILKFQAKDLAGARRSLEQVLAVRPEDAEALDSLGKTYVVQKQPEAALRTIQEYVSRRPASAPLQNLLGYWMGTNGHPDLARKAFTGAVAADPSFVSSRMSLALLDAQEGKYESARQTLALVAQAPTMQARAEITLGSIDQKLGNPSAAISHYRKAVEAEPDNATALNNLAYLLANDTDQLDEALKYAQHAKELDPKNTFVEDTIGWAFYRKGLYSSALPHLENAVAKDGAAVFKYHLAMGYLKMGNHQRGVKLLTEARKIDPSMPEADAASKLLASLNQK